MPYCTKCGSQVDAAAPFCSSCGSRQQASQAGAPASGGAAGSAPAGGSRPGAPPAGSSPAPDFTSGMRPRTAAILCYVPWFGWIAAIIVLASSRFRRDLETRFHAFQGLYLFVAWLVINMVVQPVLRFPEVGPIFPFPRAGAGILEMLIIAAWIVMIVKTRRGEHYRLPLLGELAERTVNEQRV